MAVIVSDAGNASYDGKLATANGFFRAEAYNLGSGGINANALATAAGALLAATFANAGNCQGVIVCLSNSSASASRGVAARLQEAKGTCVFDTGLDNCTLAGHGFAADQEVCFSTTGALPTGLTAAVIYYVRATNLTLNTFELATAPGGSLINLSGSPAGVHTCWPTRASSTLTFAQIAGVITETVNVMAQVYAPFSWTPYAVDTTAAKWRFHFLAGAGSGSWYLVTSDNTNPFYVTWCDNQVSFTDNDTLIVKDAVVINKTSTVAGILGTGEAVNATCGVICRNTDQTPANVALLTWENPPAASYTFTMKGKFLMGNHSGFRMGTATDPIPVAAMGIISCAAPNAGTGTTSGFFQSIGSSTTSTCASKASLFFYGEIPAVIATTLSADAATGQAVINVVDTPTGWANGDTVVVGKQDISGQGSVVLHAINGIVGNQITLTANLATANRKAGGAVFRTNGFGIRIQGASNTNFGYFYLLGASNCVMKGCETIDLRLSLAVPSYYYALDDAANRSKFTIEDNTTRQTNTTSAYFTYLTLNQEGAILQRNYSFRSTILSTTTGYSNRYLKSGTLEFLDNVTLSAYTTLGFSPSTAAVIRAENNIFENGYRYAVSLGGIGCIYKNNRHWGLGSPDASFYYTLGIGQLINPGEISGNSFDLCGTAIRILASTTVGCLDKDSVFGAEAANTVDLAIDSGALIDYEINSPAGLTTINKTYAGDTIPGSNLKFTDFNGVVNDDRGILTYGEFQRCGDGLTDTTVHTAGTGKFSMRLEPISDIGALALAFDVPTGDIQGRLMTVAVWVKIAAAAFYGGTHSNPTLQVNYDNGTLISAVAADSTDWQLLAVNFAPATTFGKITVTVSGATDALTADAYFYIDDFSVLYPAGYRLDVGGLDLWANGLPITPPIATVLSALDVWAAATAGMSGAGTIGKMLVDNVSGPSVIAAAVWSYMTRNLTQPSVSYSSLIGNIMIAKKGITTLTTITSLTIPGTWSRIYLTVKSIQDADDADSLVQVVVSNPGVAGDGLKYIAGENPTAAGLAASDASLTVNQAGGTIALMISDEATMLLTRGVYTYDVKCILTDGTSQELSASAPFLVEGSNTKALV